MIGIVIHEHVKQKSVSVSVNGFNCDSYTSAPHGSGTRDWFSVAYWNSWSDDAILQHELANIVMCVARRACVRARALNRYSFLCIPKIRNNDIIRNEHAAHLHIFLFKQ